MGVAQVFQSDKIKLRLDEILTSLIGAGLVENWWHRPNRAFDQQKPFDVFNRDRAGQQQVISYIMTQVNSDYS